MEFDARLEKAPTHTLGPTIRKSWIKTIESIKIYFRYFAWPLSAVDFLQALFLIHSSWWFAVDNTDPSRMATIA